jgi:hypothetical protein
VAPRKKALDWFALGMTVKDLAEGLWPQVTVGEETPLTLVEASEKTQLHEAATDRIQNFPKSSPQL